MAFVSIPAIEDFGGVFVLDTKHLNLDGKVAVFLLASAHKDGHFALIETGPESTLPVIKAAIKEAGFDLNKLTDILLTHIHLDHAGAAGALVKETGATVYVHERGAKHMLDPSRLLDSATRIYGELMDTLWGGMQAIPEDKLKVLRGGESLSILGHKLDVLYTPGHASHHVAFFLNNKDMFTGDVAAIRLTGSDVVRPAVPPPDINLELWQESIAKLKEAKPERLFLTHYGMTDKVTEHLTTVLLKNKAWAEQILEGMLQNEDTETLVKRITEYGNAELKASNTPPEVMERHQQSSNYEMTVTGLVRYWTKFHPELLEA